MRAAKVALFEHDMETRNILRGAINSPAGGHTVVSEAPSLGAALHVVSLMRTGHREADVVILGDDIGKNPEPGKDAQLLVSHLRTLQIVPAIIGCADVPLAEYGVTVDADISRENLLGGDSSQISQLLARL